MENLQNENSLSPKEFTVKFIAQTGVKHFINLRRPDSLITLIAVFAYFCMSTDKTYFCERYPPYQKMYNRQSFLCIFTEASKWLQPEKTKAGLVVFSYTCFGLIMVSTDKTFSVCMCFGYTKKEMKIPRNFRKQVTTT